jgi:disulfide oxidoreductase YuzD
MNLQESIQRIREMMNLNEKLEDIQGTPLYHKTSTNRGLDIINSDSLRGSLPSEEYLTLDKRLANTKTQRAISFTRDKNWTPGHTIGIGFDSPIEDSNITFVVDKDKLKTKYEVEPFNYSGIDFEHINTEKNKELEERVLTNEIYPLHKYLIDIIYTGENPEVQEIIDNYLNR